MIIKNDTITIDFASDFDEVVEELFWNDMYFNEIDGLYIYDTNQSEWYAVDNKYWYAGYTYIVQSNEVIEFHKVSKEHNKELEKEFELENNDIYW